MSENVLNIEDIDFAEKIAERVEFFNTYGNLLLSIIEWSNPLLKNVLEKLTLNSYGQSKMNVVEVLSNFKSINDSIDVTPEELLKRIDGWNRFIKKEITKENVAEKIPDIIFYENAIKIKNESTTFILNKMVEYLKSISVDIWNDSFKDETSFIFNISYLLLECNKLRTLPDNGITVYKDILKEIAHGEIEIPINSKWVMFYEKTNKNKLKPTIKNIRDIFIKDENITPTLFKYFYNMLINYGQLDKRSEDVTRKILTPVSDDDDCLKILMENKEFIKFSKISL